MQYVFALNSLTKANMKHVKIQGFILITMWGCTFLLLFVVLGVYWISDSYWPHSISRAAQRLLSSFSQKIYLLLMYNYVQQHV